MKLKKFGKIALLGFCVVALVVVTVLGTLAYFTDRDSVTNTFTVGKVSIKLDEGKVNEDGSTVDHSVRVSGNTYTLIPGRKVEKDPVLTVEAGSESSWLFVKIGNELTAIEGAPTIDSQIKANGWEPLTGKPGVYYRMHTHSSSDTPYDVFESFTVAGSATAEQLSECSSKSITVTGYAIQAEGFSDAASAWAEVGD